jgi:tetratricopeptide (TPR) repeat protein
VTDLRPLLRRPAAWPALAAGALGALWALHPLVRQPGYELATALGLTLTFTMPGWGAAVAAQARAAQATPAQVGRWTLLGGLWVVAPALVACLVAALLSPCDPWAHTAFVVALVPPVLVTTAVVGTACGLVTPTPWRALGLSALVILASALETAWPVLGGPQAFAFNALAGFFPGPLYDESLHLSAGAGWARAEGLLWAAIAVALVRVRVDLSTWRPGPGRASGRRLLAALALGLLAFRTQADALDLARAPARLDAELGGLKETAHFRLHFPRERSAREVARLERDVELRWMQDAAFLGVAPAWKVDAYFYRGTDEKQRLVGAAQTDFAKPWLHQFHVQFEGFPDPVAKHELAHVLAAEFGAWPLGISGGLANVGLIEGLATAADDPVDELSLDQWSHAMRQLGVAPDLRGLFSLVGFWREEQGRAYTLVGSFLRHLRARAGAPALQTLYRTGDWQRAYGQPLDALVTEWEQAVDQVPLDEAAMNAATRRFRAQSLFTQACARETAHLREQASARWGSAPEEALGHVDRLIALEPENPGPRQMRADLLSSMDRKPEAAQAAQGILALPHAGGAARARAALLLSELAAGDGRAEEAMALAAQALAEKPDRGVARVAELRGLKLAPEAAAVLRSYFRFPGREDALVRLESLRRDTPDLAFPSYLLGRRLSDADLPGLARRYLESQEPPAALPEVAREWRRLRVRTAALTLDCPAAEASAAQLVQASGGPGQSRGLADQGWAADWVERCRFEQGRFPLLPE